MSSAVVVFLVLAACCSIQSKDFPLQVITGIIADVHDYFHADCVYILHSNDSSDRELAAVWGQTAVLFNVGTLHVQQLIHRERDSCGNPLYVVLNSDQHLLHEVSETRKFSGANWIVFLQSTSHLSHLNVPFDCEVLLVEWDGATARISEVYRVSPQLPLQVPYFGDWSSRNRKNFPPAGLYRRRTSLDGQLITAAVLDDGIFATLDDHGEHFGGYLGHIWKELQAEMNFKSKFVRSEDGGTGSTENGTWNGMVGMLLRGKAEVGASPFLFTAQRLAVVDYTHSVAEANNNVYIKQPEVYQLPWSSSLAPFAPRLWFCVLATMCLLTFALSATCSIQNRYGNHLETRFCLRDAWLCVLGIFCQQGHDVSPHSTAPRIVYFTSYLCSIVLLAGYAGTYISFLSAGRPNVLPFTSLRGMLEDGSYRFGAMPKSAQLNLFDNATDPLFKEVYEKLILPDLNDLPHTYFDAFKRVCESKYAFMTSETLMNRYTYSSSCSCIALPEAKIQGVVGMTTRKNYPYRGLINHNLQKMRDIAVMKRFREKFLVKTVSPNHRIWETIGLEEVLPTIVVFILGVLLSVLILTFECWIGRHDRH